MKNIANNLVPELRFAGFDDEVNKWSTFNTFVESTLYGPRFNAKDYSPNGNVKTIRGTDVNSNGEFKYQQVPIAQIDQKTVDTHKLLDGDLVMITTAECGQTGVFRKQNIEYISSAYGVRIRLNSLGFPEYFKYFFQTLHAKKEIASYVRKATVANLPGSDILKIKINVISAKEQQKIANFLTAIDQRITLLEQKKTTLEHYKKGLMQKIFNQEIRFNVNGITNAAGAWSAGAVKDDDGKGFPDWEKKKLGNSFEIQGGGTPSTSNNSYWNGDINWFTPTEINLKFCNQSKRQISSLGLEKSSAKLLPIGTLLFTSRATIGDMSIALQECATNQGFLSFLPNHENIIGFLYYWILNNKKMFIRKSSGSTFLEISKKEIEKIKIFLPIKKEQQKIANFLSAIDQKLNTIDKQIADSELFKKGLLQKMFV